MSFSTIHFRAYQEEQAGFKWQARARHFWPAYERWYGWGGLTRRPSYLACRRAMRTHMPELVPLYETLTEMLGGEDAQARFLSLWTPPPFIAGCSQAIWRNPAGGAGALLRNYDFSPALLEGSIFSTQWHQQRVVAMSDCIWGVLDGMNASGVSVSLSFGGRTVVGEGFGIPVILRYVLEFASSGREAVAMLCRIPSHMCYSVTVLDKTGFYAIVHLAPDRPTQVVYDQVVTNFQGEVMWLAHARATRSVERRDALQNHINQHSSLEDMQNALMRPPVFQTSFHRGYGTLYSAVYLPEQNCVDFLWPSYRWRQTLDAFEEGVVKVDYGVTYLEHMAGAEREAVTTPSERVGADVAWMDDVIQPHECVRLEVVEGASNVKHIPSAGDGYAWGVE
ncbi:C45 family autoproteolytic acyltransferase/hydolase [Hydromonas duriensis]|uniref:Putative choloylglycine hydrolase n=1 Tax=Hydromonas duriensis TaxID=1527608 RepID=A0A4R6Y7J0_9BURK|nr:C45 family peptidase [Hydromonas duriensis]TDR31300.1 putative choloylglycine hydrolase [Hydromonas duriensis]